MSTASRRLRTLALTLLALLPAGIARSQGPDDAFAAARHRMVERIRSRGVTDAAVLAALDAVPRHLFVPQPERPKARSEERRVGKERRVGRPAYCENKKEVKTLCAGFRTSEACD